MRRFHVFWPDQAEAKRYFNYPYEAIEEALANAIYHKAHDDREPVEMRVMADHIDIVSHPGPDRSVTIEGLRDFKVFNRRYRNRRIGDFLKEMHLTEGRNTGFKKILQALERNGSPAPLFDTNETRDYFTTTFYIHPDFLNDWSNEPLNEPLNETENLLLTFIRENTFATKDQLATAPPSSCGRTRVVCRLRPWGWRLSG